MRLLFVHDHRFYRDDSGAIYTSGSLPAEVWDRYLAHFDTVQVVGRDGGPLPADAKYALSSRPGVTFELIPNVTYGQLVRGSKTLRDRIRSGVEACDAAVVRLPSELGFMAAAECRKAGKPYAVEMVGCAWDAMRNHGSWSAWLYAPLFYLRTRQALDQSPLTLYVTSRWLQQRYPTRGKAYSASDVEIAPMSAQESRRARRGFGESPKESRPYLARSPACASGPRASRPRWRPSKCCAATGSSFAIACSAAATRRRGSRSPSGMVSPTWSRSTASARPAKACASGSTRSISTSSRASRKGCRGRRLKR